RCAAQRTGEKQDRQNDERDRPQAPRMVHHVPRVRHPHSEVEAARLRTTLSARSEYLSGIGDMNGVVAGRCRDPLPIPPLQGREERCGSPGANAAPNESPRPAVAGKTGGTPCACFRELYSDVVPGRERSERTRNPCTRCTVVMGPGSRFARPG